MVYTTTYHQQCQYDHDFFHVEASFDVVILDFPARIDNEKYTIFPVKMPIFLCAQISALTGQIFMKLFKFLTTDN
jgi:hypothetical protein